MVPRLSPLPSVGTTFPFRHTRGILLSLRGSVWVRFVCVFLESCPNRVKAPQPPPTEKVKKVKKKRVSNVRSRRPTCFQRGSTSPVWRKQQTLTFRKTKRRRSKPGNGPRFETVTFTDSRRNNHTGTEDYLCADTTRQNLDFWERAKELFGTKSWHSRGDDGQICWCVIIAVLPQFLAGDARRATISVNLTCRCTVVRNCSVRRRVYSRLRQIRSNGIKFSFELFLL